MKNKQKMIITILLILVVAGIIFYPKIKPLFATDSSRSGGRDQARVQVECRDVNYSMSADF